MRLRHFAIFGYYNNFYSRTPREVRRKVTKIGLNDCTFLLTHPARGATRKDIPLIVDPSAFLLTHPARGATCAQWAVIPDSLISTHAPRERCDRYGVYFDILANPFLLTHPARGATFFLNCLLNHQLFLLTHPARGATGILFQLFRTL